MDRFAALAEPNRRRVIEMIAANGEMAASEISGRFDISAGAVSQHLKVLREAGLVSMEKRAQKRIYRINPEGVDEMWEWLNRMREIWNTRFDALDKLVTKPRKKGDKK